MPETIRSKRVIFMDRNRCVYRKLKSVKGATLMVALLFFLVCACVGSVILAAANTTAGRVSSVKESGNSERYAVSSALKLIRTEMNKQNTMSVTQSWNANYTVSIDSDGNYSEPTLDNGNKWVMALNDSDWSGYVKTVGDSSNSNASTYLFNAEQLNNNAELYQIRDLMAYQIYRHYWNTIINSQQDSTESSDSNSDPWYMLAMGTEEWSSILGENSDTTYKITSSKPYEIKLDDNSMKTVYAAFSMDSSFNFTVKLYTLEDIPGSDSSSKEKTKEVNVRYLIYKPQTSEINRVSSETVSSQDKSQIKYNMPRSVALSIVWDDGEISTSAGGSNENAQG
jgi:hypothetical protein